MLPAPKGESGAAVNVPSPAAIAAAGAQAIVIAAAIAVKAPLLSPPASMPVRLTRWSSRLVWIQLANGAVESPPQLGDLRGAEARPVEDDHLARRKRVQLVLDRLNRVAIADLPAASMPATANAPSDAAIAARARGVPCARPKPTGPGSTGGLV